jgi:endosialidase-like protein
MTMFKKTLSGLVLTSMLIGSAHAICPTFPYSFTNGSTADASQVNGNFNNVITCFAPLASPSFTGSVGIGTATPGALLDVYSTSTNSTAINITNAAAGGHIWTLYSSGGGPAGSGSFGIYDSTSGGNRLVIATSGNVGIGTAAPSYTLQVNGTAGGTYAWTTISDARLKKNVEEIADALGLIKRLRPVRYDWRPADEREVGKTLNLPTDEKQIGFIAQEVATVVPEAAVVPKNSSSVQIKVPNASGGFTTVTESTSYYGLKEANLIPLLVQAVKEQQAQIEQLRATVEALQTGK